MDEQHREQSDEKSNDQKSVAGNFEKVPSILNEVILSVGEGHGSEILVQRYNINDKAHSDSSFEDFIPTTSSFHHAEKRNDKADKGTS